MSVCKFDIICLSVIWLSNKLLYFELFRPSDYLVYRNYRDHAATGLSTGGGTLIAVNARFPTTSINLDMLLKNFPLIDIV